jgi:hypothetical protein
VKGHANVPLSKKQIQTLLDMLAQETVVEPTSDFPYRISRRASGYSKNPEVGTLQAALSLGLQMAGA